MRILLLDLLFRFSLFFRIFRLRGGILFVFRFFFHCIIVFNIYIFFLLLFFFVFFHFILFFLFFNFLLLLFLRIIIIILITRFFVVFVYPIDLELNFLILINKLFFIQLIIIDNFINNFISQYLLSPLNASILPIKSTLIKLRLSVHRNSLSINFIL